MTPNDNEVKAYEIPSEIELFTRNAMAFQVKMFEQTLDWLDKAA